MTYGEWLLECAPADLSAEAETHAGSLEQLGYDPDGTPALIRALLARLLKAEQGFARDGSEI